MFILSAVAILLNISNVLAVFQFPFTIPNFIESEVKANSPIKILSYNVKAFNVCPEKEKRSAFKGIIKVIKEEKPDIICFQEYSFLRKGKYSMNKLLAELKPAKFYYAFYGYGSRTNEGEGIAILSRYPMVKNKKLSFKRSCNAAMFADLNIKGTLVRVYNVHLQSILLIKENYDYLDTLGFYYSEESQVAMKKITLKLHEAYRLRAKQADLLAAHIQQSPNPTILCGDFNDTPVSYTYRKMKGNMNDAFREAGHGLGRTFNGLSPSLRIDYIFSTNQFQVLEYKTIHCHYSDHYPIKAKILLD